MEYVLNLYSINQKEVPNFFNSFYESNNFSNWEMNSYPKSDNKQNDIYLYTKRTTNPIDFVVLLGVLVDNNHKYKINPWLSLDKGFFINITDNNIDSVIKYIYERFPY